MPVVAKVNAVQVPAGGQDGLVAAAGDAAQLLGPAGLPHVHHRVFRNGHVVIEHFLPHDEALLQIAHDVRQSTEEEDVFSEFGDDDYDDADVDGGDDDDGDEDDDDDNNDDDDDDDDDGDDDDDDDGDKGDDYNDDDKYDHKHNKDHNNEVMKL